MHKVTDVHGVHKHGIEDWELPVEHRGLQSDHEDISKTFLVILETLNNKPRISRQILANNKTDTKEKSAEENVWTKSHMIEELSNNEVQRNSKIILEKEAQEQNEDTDDNLTSKLKDIVRDFKNETGNIGEELPKDSQNSQFKKLKDLLKSWPRNTIESVNEGKEQIKENNSEENISFKRKEKNETKTTDIKRKELKETIKHKQKGISDKKDDKNKEGGTKMETNEIEVNENNRTKKDVKDKNKGDEKNPENKNRRSSQVLRTPNSARTKVKWGAWGKGFVSIASQSFGGGKGKDYLKINLFSMFYFSAFCPSLYKNRYSKRRKTTRN